ncbi:hypothetical protein [Streptomyces mayteni]
MTTHDVANSVLTVILALRVLGPDVKTSVCWMLGTGVRIGVADLTQRQHHLTPPAATPAATRDRGGDL